MFELSSKDLQICKNVMENEWFHYSDEEFRYITYPDIRPFTYVVSNYGNVISLINCKLIKPFDNNGYLRICLSGQELGSQVKVRVHRLVAWEFCEGYNPEEGCDIVNHKDSNRRNNYVDNLEWCTTSYNNKHTGMNEDYYSSQRNIDKDDVIKICELFVEGYTPKEVFTQFTGFESTCKNESLYTTLKNIYNRKTYKNVSNKYSWEIIDFKQKLKSEQYKFDDNTINRICSLFSEGKSVKDVFNIITGKHVSKEDKSSYIIISNIYKRKSHKRISDNYLW